MLTVEHKHYRLWSSLLLMLMALTVTSYGQRENVWIFGINAGLNFNTNPPTAITANLNSTEGSASVCDENGQLLFYTTGGRVWDQSNGFMQNGFEICPYIINSTTQGALIVPMPDSSSKYYIFSLTPDEYGAESGRLYYSVVDMDLNNGFGAVLNDRKGILIDTGLSENMTAVAGKTCNIWLLTMTKQGVLKAISIDHDGLHYTTPILSSLVPPNIPAPIFKTGSMDVSPDRTKLAVANTRLYLCDFNAVTGIASNSIDLSSIDSSAYYAACFSPGSSKLYASQLGNRPIEQFDLSSGNPATISGSLQNITQNVTVGGAIKRGPDSKVYCVQPQNSFLGVIHQPELAGTACLYDAQGINFIANTHAYLGLPNVVPVIIPNGDSLFSTQIIDVSNCFTNTYTLHADNAATGLVWNNGSTSAQRTINGPGTYWVNYFKHCIWYSDTFVVHFPNALPGIAVYPACKGSNNGMARAYTDNTGYQYTWRNGSGVVLASSDSLTHVSGGNYTLQVITPSGCDTTINIVIPIEDHIASFQADSIACQGTNINFNNTSDIYFTNFHWSFGDGDSTSAINPVHSYDQAGNYNIKLLAEGAVCIDSVFQTIVVDSLFTGIYHATPESICMGKVIVFLTDTNATVVNRIWSYGDGTTWNTASDYLVQHAYDSAGIFPVLLTTEYRACPSYTFADTTYVYALPKVFLGDDSALCLHGKPILLRNQFTAPTETYQSYWNTGDTTAALLVSHPGTYQLTVSVTPLGCSTTESVTIKKDCYIDIPNAFTPNGDGENDYFFPRQLLSRKVTEFSMQILNSWGQLIFKTTDIKGRGWDGNFNGKSQPQGVYIYLIEATIDNEEQESYKGNVTLIR